MSVHINSIKGREAAKNLHTAFATTGIHGRTEMPEDLMPKGIVRGSLEHILFITLTVTIDYQRDADLLWESARRTYEDPETRYLFHLKSLADTNLNKIKRDMGKYKLSKKHNKDPEYWKTVGESFFKKWNGDPRNFLRNCGWSAPLALQNLKKRSHVENGKKKKDFPYLSGDKIGPLWVRMMRDNAEIEELHHLERVPIPVDRHIARATLSIGIVRGYYKGNLNQIFETIRKAWFESVEGLTINGREMIALDVDEPLWHLSKYGCTDRDKNSGYCRHIQNCEAEEYCIPGRVLVNENTVELNT